MITATIERAHWAQNSFFRRVVLPVLLFGAIICLAPLSNAQEIPPQILADFKQYQTAMANHKIKKAEKYIKSAYDQAESQLGDHHITGSLAHKYGDAAQVLSKFANAQAAFARAIELAPLAQKKREVILLNRENALLGSFVTNEMYKEALKLGSATVERIAENPNPTSQAHAELMGNIMVQTAMIMHRKANTRRHQSKTLGLDASEIANQIIRLDQKQFTLDKNTIYFAHMLVGYGNERNENWIEAVLAYQKALVLSKTKRGFEDENHAKAYGRWHTSRIHLRGLKKIEQAQEQGMFESWPVGEGTNEPSIKAIKRVPPISPRHARTSGFVIILYDVTDAGETSNIRVLHSWPKGVYEKAAIKSVKKWEFEAKTPETSHLNRKKFKTTIGFHISSGLTGKPL